MVETVDGSANCYKALRCYQLAASLPDKEIFKPT